MIAYGVGMALFTMVMGNAFAAFPVMAAAIGLPLLVHGYGADPAPGRGDRYACGFLRHADAPMAANFNLVPRGRLLDLKDRSGVIQGADSDSAAAASVQPRPAVAGDPMTPFDPSLASRFAAVTLGHIGQEYPHKLDHVLDGPADAATPSALHPIFHGSFDWHSCVHGWWQLLCLVVRLFPDLPEAASIRARADTMLTPDKVAGELAYLARASAGGFERPYGWAWALALHGEAVHHDAPWGAALEPLARAFAAAVHRLPAQADLSDPRRHARQQRLRPAARI